MLIDQAKINNFGRIYPKYDVTYPAELDGYISKAEFEQSIFEINEDLAKLFYPEYYTTYVRPIAFFLLYTYIRTFMLPFRYED